MAPGLFLLDKNKTHGTYYLLDALDDATLENGCLHYIAGSHRWGLLPKPVIAGELHGIKDFLNEQQQKQFEHPQPAPVKAGEAIFHHPLTLHGSGENKSEQPAGHLLLMRLLMVLVSDSNEPLLEGVRLCKKARKWKASSFLCCLRERNKNCRFIVFFIKNTCTDSVLKENILDTFIRIFFKPNFI